MKIYLRPFEGVEIITKNDRLVVFSGCNGILNSNREHIEPTNNDKVIKQ